jgi:hypothetical protein
MKIALLLLAFASVVGGIIGGIIGNTFNYPFTGFIWGAALVLGAYLAYQIEILNEKEAKILQLLGKFSRCLNRDGESAGIYLVARPFEKVFKRVLVKQDFPIQLYRDAGERAEVDFKDCSSTINATAWLRVEDPVKYCYEVTNPEQYTENFIDSTIRPEFAIRTLDQANSDKDQIARDNLSGISDDLLDKAGARMTKLFIEDFAFPEEVKTIRKDLLRGETDAKKIEARTAGWVNSIAGIAKGLVNEGMPQNEAIQKATEIFFEQTGMETVREAQANITFISEKVKGMMGFFAPSGQVPRQRSKQP